MRVIYILVFLISASLSGFGQKSDKSAAVPVPKHFISVNPLNVLFFQQAGITYEYKPGTIGYGITAGYIYPNYKTYSNYFIAGPTLYGSLGDYSGFFVVPQVNVYLIKPKKENHGSLVYLALKVVYKNMHIDSTKSTAWENKGDGYYIYRKMNDNVNIYGAFVDFGYKLVLNHFFLDLNFGVGATWINHDMTVSGEHLGLSPEPTYYLHPPMHDEVHQNPVTVNFTLNFGAAF